MSLLPLRLPAQPGTVRDRQGTGKIAPAQLELPQAIPERGPLDISDAITQALNNNPELLVIRKNRGIAAAGALIARTYPFNPTWQSFVMGANGPESAGVTNHVFIEQTLRLDLELRGQGKIRRSAAQAAVSRTEWEIIAQELGVAVRVVRAFDAYIYRREKLKMIDETIVLQEQTAERVKRLVDQGKLRGSDLLLARSDIIDSRAARGPAQSALVAAGNDLRRLLALENDSIDVTGSLLSKFPKISVESMKEIALQGRPDLHAMRLSVEEAEQRYRLEIANRYGNPSIGPAMEYNETRAVFVGMWMIYQLPTFNTRRGEIQQRQAEKERLIMDQRRVEMQIGFDLQAVQNRFTEAQKWVDYFAQDALPTLINTMGALDKLFAQGEPGMDVLRLIDGRRRLLRARDSYLDALWELNQAKADLAQVVGSINWIMEAEADSTPKVSKKAEMPMQPVQDRRGPQRPENLEELRLQLPPVPNVAPAVYMPPILLRPE